MGAPIVTVWGIVNADGSIASGSGDFTATKTGTGKYEIQFTTQYTQRPAVLAMQIHNGNLKDGCLAAEVTTSKCTILTGEEDGSRSSRTFSFTATGN